jgi:hypothetical protein
LSAANFKDEIRLSAESRHVCCKSKISPSIATGLIYPVRDV